jgi:hypothetical protein
MVTFPISVKRNTYSGRDPRKRARAIDENRVALELERHINAKLEKQQDPIHAYMYHELAWETGHHIELVRRLCFSIDCGGNGFTVIRHGMTIQQAVEAMGLAPGKRDVA